MEKALQKGDYVILTGKSEIWGDPNPILSEIRDKKYVGILTTPTQKYDDGYRNRNVQYTYVSFVDTGFPVTINIETKHIKVVNKGDFDTCVLNISKLRKELVKKILPKRQSLLLRNIDHGQMQNLNTNLNFVKKGTWNVKSNAFTSTGDLYNQVCCAFSRSNLDYQFFIPEFWLRYYGYTKVDLKRWLEFLKGCDIDFNYSYDGIVENHGIKPQFNVAAAISMDSKTLKNAVIIPNNEFHQVNMKGSNTNTLHTYLRFILVRYLYNNQYWSIAVRAIQIKRALENKVSNWQALLMAHFTDAYNPYYALWGAGISGRTDSHTSARNTTNVINIKKATPEYMLKTLTGSVSMNTSFPVIDLSPDKYEKFVRAQDWEAFYDVLKKNAVI